MCYFVSEYLIIFPETFMFLVSNVTPLWTENIFVQTKSFYMWTLVLSLRTWTLLVIIPCVPCVLEKKYFQLLLGRV